jgi:fatty acid desaturase
MSQTLQPAIDLNDPDFLRRVNALRKTDNWTNWLYLLREYTFLALVIGLTVAWCEFLWLEGWSLWWAVPAVVVCNLCVGAGQHRLATLTHEAAHYMLFRNRLLNEFVSEWFCMFPILGTTHSYRVQHLGHHQYPNDPERDPDWTQMSLSGHRYKFPMSRAGFLWECVIKQVLWFPKLLRYVAVRAFFKPDGPDGSPYRMKRRAAVVLRLFSAAYLLGLIGVLSYLVWNDMQVALALVPAAFLAVGLAFFLLAPERWFTEFAVKSDIPMRWQNTLRLVFMTLLATAVAWATVWTGRPVWLYFFLLWLVPLGTSFSFFMILRQIVQHGNADGERYTNTRVFHVHPLISMSVFPIGNDYHLPHHLFPMVPHFNLRKLHALLLEKESYRREAVLVEGYFIPKERPRTNPTVLDVMTRGAETVGLEDSPSDLEGKESLAQLR